LEGGGDVSYEGNEESALKFGLRGGGQRVRKNWRRKIRNNPSVLRA